MGFIGALKDDICYDIEDMIPEDVESVCVPFLGSGKAVSLMVRPHRLIEAWDTQFLLRCVVEGVWTQKKPDVRITEPKLRKGYTYHERPFYRMPDKAAALIDYIAAHSSMYEKVALATAIARNTYRGRLGEWSPNGTAESVWTTFRKRLEAQKEYLNLPGTILFHEQNFYEADLTRSYDYAYIDPPKIVTNTDAYSGTFGKLNLAIGADPNSMVDFDRWTRYDYVGRIRKCIESIKSRNMIFVYTSDVRPNLEEMKQVLADYGTLLSEVRARHGGRYDYALHYERK